MRLDNRILSLLEGVKGKYNFKNITSLTHYSHHIVSSSIDLAVSGQYTSANMLLRQFYEIYIRAIYYDEKSKIGCPRSLKQKIHEWSKGELKEPITGKNGLNKKTVDLIKPEYLDIVIKIGKDNRSSWISKGKKLNKILDTLYRELSKTVHTGLINHDDEKEKLGQNVPILHFEYREEHFKQFFNYCTAIHELTSLIIILTNPILLEMDEAKWSGIFDIDQQRIKKIYTVQKENKV